MPDPNDPATWPRGHYLTEDQAAWVRARLIDQVGWPSSWPTGIGAALDPSNAATYARVRHLGRGVPAPCVYDFEEDGEGGTDV